MRNPFNISVGYPEEKRFLGRIILEWVLIT
jgi:hypothetical protein